MCLIVKFGATIGPKMPYLGILGLGFESTILTIEIHALEIA